MEHITHFKQVYQVYQHLGHHIVHNKSLFFLLETRDDNTQNEFANNFH